MQIISLIGLCACLSACGAIDSDSKPRQEVSSYEVKTVDVDIPLQLKLDCDYGEIEVYNWDKKQVKFEITRRIRGNQKKEQLEMKLKKLNVDIQKKGKTISFTGECGLRAADYPDCCIIIRMYVPRRVAVIDCNFIKGRIKLLDDLKCNMNIIAQNVNVEINSLEGRFKYKADEGGVRISAGELEKGSGIWTGKGNIDVSASCREGGDYTLDTGSGMIRLKVPKNIKATFKYLGAEENINSDEVIDPARFKLRAGIGKIEIIRT